MYRIFVKIVMPGLPGNLGDLPYSKLLKSGLAGVSENCFLPFGIEEQWSSKSYSCQPPGFEPLVHLYSLNRNNY